MTIFFKALDRGIKQLSASVKVFFDKRYSRCDIDPARDGLTYWRERILFAILAVSACFCLIALAPALYMAIGEGLWLLTVIDIVASLGCGSLLFF